MSCNSLSTTGITNWQPEGWIQLCKMVFLGSHDGLEQRLHKDCLALLCWTICLAHRRAGKGERERGDVGCGRNKRTWVMAEGLEWKCNTFPPSQVACPESSLCGAELEQAGSLRASAPNWAKPEEGPQAHQALELTHLLWWALQREFCWTYYIISESTGASRTPTTNREGRQHQSCMGTTISPTGYTAGADSLEVPGLHTNLYVPLSQSHRIN